MTGFDFEGAALRGRVTGFLAALLFVLLADTLTAFRAAAFETERLAIGFARALFDFNERPFAEDFGEDRRDAERRTPFAMGLLIVILN